MKQLIINFSHFKGGVGKTSLSLSVTTALIKTGYEVTILDLDGLESSILFNKIRVKNGYASINCITLKKTDMGEVVAEMKDIFKDFIGDDKILIIDSGGYDGDINRFAMLSSDIIITPVSPSQVEVFGLQKYMGVLKQISEKSGQIFKTNIVINNADIRSKQSIVQLKEFIVKNDTYMDLYETIVYSRADFKKAYGEGLGVVELDENSKAALEIMELIKEIQKDF